MNSISRFQNKYLQSFSIAGVAILLLRLVVYHWEVMVNIYPNEFREAAMLTSTQALLQGLNPYSLEQQPQCMNVYGILYPLFNVPLAMLGGVTLPLHRTVSGFFILASCLLLYGVMKRMQIGFFDRLSGTTIFYGHSIYACSHAYPNALGMFLFLCTIFVPWLYKYNSLSLFASILLGILGFLSKPYFVLGIPYVFLYLLLRNWRRAFGYGIATTFFLSITLMSLNWLFPLYLNNTLFVHNNVADRDWVYMLRQLSAYGQNNLWLLLILSVPLAFYLFENRDDLLPRRLWSMPKLIRELDLVSVCLILSTGLFVCKLGLHTGAWLIYLHHLVSPFAIIVIFGFLSKYQLSIFKAACIVFTILNLRSGKMLANIPPGFYQPWEKLATEIQAAPKVLSSPIAASLILQQHKTIWDNGESEYLTSGLNNFLGSQQDIKNRAQQHKNMVKQQLVDGAFDLVISTPRFDNEIIDKVALEEHYRKKDTIDLAFPFNQAAWRFFTVNTYVRK
jgi:hypothetical protein